MQLYPPTTKEQAEAWLSAQAVATWGLEKTAELSNDIAAMAEAMAAISDFMLDDELEPLFP